MKNFRKVLAMVLVVATLMGFATMAGAKVYTDAEKITADYEQAVNVLSTIGILEGYEDDSFRPTNNITRAEMAKMIAVLANKGTDVSKLYASANKFADMKGNWAESYVAYCAQTGIVAGRNATTFDPKANVTGLETAKMLLVVLGLDAEKQGYVGADWAVNVLRDAKEFGLLTGFASGWDITKAITREEASQMMYNALNACMVYGYISNNILTITNKVLNGNDLTLTDAKANGTLYYNNVWVSNKPLYGIYGGLERTNGRDCFGRPTVEWTYTNAKKVTVTVAETPLKPDATYTKANTIAKDFKTELTANANRAAYDLKVFVNGTDAGITTVAGIPTGNGIVTEVYVNDTPRSADPVNGRTVTVVVINTYIDVVTATNSYSKTMTVAGHTVKNDCGAAKGDYILYTLCDGSCKAKPADYAMATGYYMHAAKVATPVTATVKNTFVATGSRESFFVADAKEYTYAKNYNVNAVGDVVGTYTENGTDVNNVLGKAALGLEVDIYVDTNGYVMLIDEHVTRAETFVAYFVENAWTYNYPTVETPAGNNQSWTNDAVYFDKTIKEDVAVDQVLFNHAKWNSQNLKIGRLFQYTLNRKGEATVAQASTVAAAGVTLSNRNDKLEGHILNDKTQFMIRTYNFTTGEFEYETFTGYKNLKNTYTSYTLTGMPGLTNIQYLLDNTAGAVKHVTHVFIDAMNVAEANSFYAVEYLWEGADDLLANASYNGFGVEVAKQLDNYHVYEAIVNGETALVATKVNNLNTFNATTTADKDCMYKTDLVAIGVVTYQGLKLQVFGAPVTPVKESAVTADEFKLVGGRLELYNAGALVNFEVKGVATNSIYVAEGFKVTNIVKVNGVIAKIVVSDAIEPYAPGAQTCWVVANAMGEAVELIRIVNG